MEDKQLGSGGLSGQPVPSGDAGAETGVVPPTEFRGSYSSWVRRAYAWMIDFAPHLVASAVLAVGYGAWLLELAGSSTSRGAGIPPIELTASMPLGFGLWMLALGWQLANRWLVAGRTGQSLGKRAMGIALVSQDNGRPIGRLNAFVRDLVHIFDGLTGAGYLWPLWDERRQTLGDKLMRTIVVDWREDRSEAVRRG